MAVLPDPAPDCGSCAARDERIAAQDELIGELRDALGGQGDQIAALREQVARLERVLNRNSGNSSMPPSSDDVPGKKQPRPKGGRGAGKRRPGKQPGAPGAWLEWNDVPDRTVPVFPAGACACGADLAGAQDLGVTASHQVTDIPAAQAEVVQHDRHPVQCRCGRVHTAPAPDGAAVPGTATYGPQMQALCVFLMVMHHVPVARCADIIEVMCGTRPSDGFVHSLLARAARGAAAACRLIRALIILARVICADETPIRVGPGPKSRKKYLLVACTRLLTCYFLGGRDLGTFNAFVFPDLAGTVVVHDRYVNYDSIEGIVHQLCCSHLLRDLEDAAESYPDAIWPGQVAGALRALIHAANMARDQDLAAVPADAITEELKLFRNGVAVGLAQVPRIPGSGEKQLPGRLLLECLRDRRDDVLRFLTDLRIPPTSNDAERDLRPSKTQQKISGRLRSETATRHRYALRGYLSTAAKHGFPVFTAILGALTGNPWMPPIPDAS
jgi:transposase